MLRGVMAVMCKLVGLTGVKLLLRLRFWGPQTRALDFFVCQVLTASVAEHGLGLLIPVYFYIF
jgi:hypothetical protein